MFFNTNQISLSFSFSPVLTVKEYQSETIIERTTFTVNYNGSCRAPPGFDGPTKYEIIYDLTL